MNTKPLFKLKFFNYFQILLLLIILALLLGAYPTFVHAEPPASPNLQSNNPMAPHQAAMVAQIQARQELGLPVPTIITTYNMPGNIQGSRGNAIVATTTIHYNGPEEAGYETWPNLEYDDSILPDGWNGDVADGDYTELYRAAVESVIPGIWDEVEFGEEARTITFTETITAPTAAEISAFETTLVDASTNEDILLGFTLIGPGWDYTIEFDVVFDVPGAIDWIPGIPDTIRILSFRGGIELDWAFGLRLPANVTMTGPAQMVRGQSYNIDTVLTAENWNAGDYDFWDVSPQDGYEMPISFNFFVGAEILLLPDIEIDIFGFSTPVNLCPSCSIQSSFDESSSFATPVGNPIVFPTLDIVLFSIPLPSEALTIITAQVGVSIAPSITSDNISAKWDAFGTGNSGTVEYDTSGATETFGLIEVCDTDEVTVQLSDFRYNLDGFNIGFGVFFQVLLPEIGFELLGEFIGYPGGTVRVDIPILTLSVANILDGLYLGKYIEYQAGNIDFSDGFNFDDIFTIDTGLGPDNVLQMTIPVVDIDPPDTDIASLTGDAGNNGWYVSNVDVELEATDMPEGCGSGIKRTEYRLNDGDWTTYTGVFEISTEGENELRYRSIDNEDNVETAELAIIKIDKTPPVITGAPTEPPNQYGWYNEDVTVDFTSYDPMPGSGIEDATDFIIVSEEGENISVEGFARDVAGWVTYYTVEGINLDKTPPELSLDSPLAGDYPNTESITFAWTASDALSGIATEEGFFDGEPINNGDSMTLLLLKAGDYEIFVEVVDKADNVTTDSVIITVTVDLAGLGASLDYMCEIGWVTNHGVCNAMRVKINAALRQMERCRVHVATNQLNALLHLLDAQNGKKIIPEGYDVMYFNTNHVIDNLSSDECTGAMSLVNAEYNGEGAILAPLTDVSVLPEIANSTNTVNNSNNSNNSSNANNNGNNGNSGKGKNGG